MGAVLPSPADCCATNCGEPICVTTPLAEIITELIGQSLFKCGHGDPNGVETGAFCNQPYLDLDTNTRWAFAGTPGTNTGWV